MIERIYKSLILITILSIFACSQAKANLPAKASTTYIDIVVKPLVENYVGLSGDRLYLDFLVDATYPVVDAMYGISLIALREHTYVWKKHGYHSLEKMNMAQSKELDYVAGVLNVGIDSDDIIRMDSFEVVSYVSLLKWLVTKFDQALIGEADKNYTKDNHLKAYIALLLSAGKFPLHVQGLNEKFGWVSQAQAFYLQMQALFELTHPPARQSSGAGALIQDLNHQLKSAVLLGRTGNSGYKRIYIEMASLVAGLSETQRYLLKSLSAETDHSFVEVIPGSILTQLNKSSIWINEFSTRFGIIDADITAFSKPKQVKGARKF